MGLILSRSAGSAVSERGMQVLPPPKRKIRSLAAKARRRRLNAAKRLRRRHLRRRSRREHQWSGEPSLLDISASRSVVGLNRDSLNLRKDLRVGTLNTRTLKDAWRVEEACRLASKRSIDLLCVQEHRIRIPETTETGHHVRHLEGGWAHCLASAGDGAHGGVCVPLSLLE